MNIKAFEGTFNSAIDLFSSIIIKAVDGAEAKEFHLYQKYDSLRFQAGVQELLLDLKTILKDFEFPISISKGSLLDFIEREELAKFVASVRKIMETLPERAKPEGIENQDKTTLKETTKVETRTETPYQRQPELRARPERQQHPNRGLEQFPPGFPLSGQVPIGTGIGSYDLDPFAGSRGFVGIGSGAMPSGGGMIVGPDHPMFRGQGSRNPSFPGQGPLTFPPGSVPPGARFDPTGPFDIMGPGVRPRGQRPPFSGDPDNDEFMPPGM